MKPFVVEVLHLHICFNVCVPKYVYKHMMPEYPYRGQRTNFIIGFLILACRLQGLNLPHQAPWKALLFSEISNCLSKENCPDKNTRIQDTVSYNKLYCKSPLFK